MFIELGRIYSGLGLRIFHESQDSLLAICNKITEQVIVKCPGFRGKGTNI